MDHWNGNERNVPYKGLLLCSPELSRLGLISNEMQLWNDNFKLGKTNEEKMKSNAQPLIRWQKRTDHYVTSCKAQMKYKVHIIGATEQPKSEMLLKRQSIKHVTGKWWLCNRNVIITFTSNVFSHAVYVCMHVLRGYSSSNNEYFLKQNQPVDPSNGACVTGQARTEFDLDEFMWWASKRWRYVHNK